MRSIEAEKGHQERIESGFYARFMHGSGLDIGYRGYNGADEPVLPTAIGVDLDYPDYDGLKLPFENISQDYVFASHVLEHIDASATALKEWWRVVKIGGHLIICVPHRDLFEKKWILPSTHCEDHKRFYTAESLLEDIYYVLPMQKLRIVSLREIDTNFDYSNPGMPDTTVERYEIELVLKKIKKPDWDLK